MQFHNSIKNQCLGNFIPEFQNFLLHAFQAKSRIGTQILTTHWFYTKITCILLIGLTKICLSCIRERLCSENQTEEDVAELILVGSPDTQERIIRLLGKHKNLEPSAWTAATTLEEVGVDSFDFIEFVFLLEDEFKIEIEYNHNDVGAHFNTIGDVANAVDRFMAEKAVRTSETVVRSEVA
jgi:acyl carrier protein